MEYSVYVLRNKNRRHYVGISGDVSKRLKQHNGGDVRSTRFYRPWIVIYSESYESRESARKREVQLKSSFEERNKIFSSY